LRSAKVKCSASSVGHETLGLNMNMEGREYFSKVCCTNCKMHTCIHRPAPPSFLHLSVACKHMQLCTPIHKMKRGVELPEDTGVVLDFCSLWQRGGGKDDKRTEEQLTQFIAGLAEINCPYGHAGEQVCIGCTRVCYWPRKPPALPETHGGLQRARSLRRPC